MEHIEGILLLYSVPPNPLAATISDHITCFEKYSSYPVYSTNVLYGFPARLSAYSFSVILIHYSAVSQGRKGDYYSLDDGFLSYLKDSKSYKVAIFQDEYHYCVRRFRFINEFDIHTVYTCYDQRQVPKVYGEHTNARRVVTHIPGHISDDMLVKAQKYAKPFSDRSIDVSYRGKSPAFYYGKGAREKYEIGLLFPEYASRYGLKMDIGVKEKDRIYGEAWYEFLGDSRAVLGVESGVDLTDLDGSIRKNCDDYIEQHPNCSFEEVFKDVLEHFEGNIPLRTISPRHLEACVYGCVQILYEGQYSGILHPDRHYIPLAKDFSNFGEVISKFRDRDYCSQLLLRCQEEIVQNKKYHYSGFVEEFDDLLIQDEVFKKEKAYDYKKDLKKTFKPSLLKSTNAYVRTKNFPGKDVLNKLLGKNKRL